MNRPNNTRKLIAIKGMISYSLRCQNLAKESLIKAKFAKTDIDRYNIALAFLGKIIELCELVGQKGTNEEARDCITSADKAWREFANKIGNCGGFFPSGAWFRQCMIQIAFDADDYDETRLAENLEGLGWRGDVRDYIDPIPKDGEEIWVIDVDVVRV